MSNSVRLCLAATIIAVACLRAQDAPAPVAKQALDHVIGSITAVDAGAHTVTVKEDKTALDHTILLANTKTLLKVDPGAKDLKAATRITADDLEVGDRVDVRGLKAEDNPNALAAKSIVLMSGRDLQKVRQAQAAEWQHSSNGTVAAVDAASGKLTVNSRGAEGLKVLTVETGKSTEFTRYSTANPKTPALSQISDIEPGDQVRVIGEKSEDGSTVKAQKLYSGAFRTISATITAITPDGKAVTVKDLATKKPVEIALGDESAIRKLPPMMAMLLARRFNPNFKMPEGMAGGGMGGRPAGAAGSTNPSPSSGTANQPDANQATPGAWQRSAGSGNPQAGGSGMQGGGSGFAGPGGTGGARGPGSGDVSQMLERVPKIAVSDLKPGDAVVISGIATAKDNSKLLATNIIAGVEPILQSAPQRQSGSVGGDWGLGGGEMAAPQ